MNSPSNQIVPASVSSFPAAKFIKEIGRGKEGARSLSCEDAFSLYSAMLNAQVSDLEMGAILLAMRIKGESIAEVSGFLDAAHAQALASCEMIAALTDVPYAPILIPSYNGARKKPNLTALLALLLAREGAPVLVHGVSHDVGRVTTLEVFAEMGIDLSMDCKAAHQALTQRRLAVMAIAQLSPKMHRLLSMRQILGVRNSTHTLVKLLQVFQSPALRLSSYTHPEYRIMLDEYLRTVAPEQGATLLMRGSEGETVANTGRGQQIDCYYQGRSECLREADSQLVGEPDAVPNSLDAKSTAAWIRRVMAGEVAVPANIAQQVQICLAVSRRLVPV
ncbi:MAG: DNA-binding protein YbiB [Burkholderiales bacterium]|nr:DNA-binding protein YbiB [Burkholderiales bacterium]